MKHFSRVMAVIGIGGLVLSASVASSATAAGSHPRTEVITIVGSATVRTMSTTPAGPKMTDTSTFNGRCSVPSNAIVGSSGTGTVKNLGTFTLTGTHCAQFDPVTAVGTFTDGRFTYVFRKGTLVGTHVGAFVVKNNLTYAADTFFMTSGTGHFAGGSGQITDILKQDSPGNVLQLTMNGVIRVPLQIREGR